ncbi:uncharacterized protein LOC143224058 [Tachypleus tridentatus]|uniref:uncharacterized protein LOC143224058 n=1 Tax=Tachypleus tridentatus TaxID=6853 RepID=UPI003FD0099A
MKPKILLKRFLSQEALGKLIFVGSLIGFIFQSFQFLQLFMEYQTTMDISIEPRSGVIFPAVTVCSFEMFRNSYDEIWKALRRNYIEEVADVQCNADTLGESISWVSGASTSSSTFSAIKTPSEKLPVSFRTDHLHVHNLLFTLVE